MRSNGSRGQERQDCERSGREQPREGTQGRTFRRYAQILEAAAAAAEFTLADLLQACGNETPRFVSRVVGELERDGRINRQQGRQGTAFRWTREPRQAAAERWLTDRIYGSQLCRTPPPDRPRERLMAWGAAALRTAELLAILIRAGRPGESALQAGEKIANQWADRLAQLPQASRGELHGAAAAAQLTAYCQIMAGIELGRRVTAAQHAGSVRPPAIRSTDDAIRFCRGRFARLASDAVQEEFHVVCLNTSHHVAATHRISVGTLDSTSAHPREVFRVAIKDAAAAILVVHNHPAGDPDPSIEDLSVTQRLDDVAQVVGIPILDHIIVAARGATSIREYEQLLLEERITEETEIIEPAGM